MSDKERFEPRSQDFILVTDGHFIYIGIGKQEDFDKIAVPMVDHGENDRGHVLAKTVVGGGVQVVFQYWLKSVTTDALIADKRAKA